MTAAGAVPGHLAVPSGEGPWPGVVVIHQAFGLDDDVRAITDRFAAEGYLAFAPDLMATGNRIACLVRVAKSMSTGEGRAGRHGPQPREPEPHQVPTMMPRAIAST